MAAYLIYARREITDEEVSKQYSQQAVPQIRGFGGGVLACPQGSTRAGRRLGAPVGCPSGHVADGGRVGLNHPFDGFWLLGTYGPRYSPRERVNGVEDFGRCSRLRL